MREVNFKHTEIDLIPHDWEVKTIADVAQTSSGGTPSRSVPSYYEGSIRWFTTGELCDGLLIDSLEHITPEALSSSSAKLFKEGTLLMAMYGATIGKLGILSKPSTTNQACCAIMCNDIQTKYLFFQLLFHRESIIAMGRGAGQPNISQDIVKRLQLPLPPTLAEQERIAGALSSIDTLIGALNEQIEKKRHIKQGTMQQLLTGKKRLAGFTGKWKICKIKNIVGSVKRGQGLQSKDYVKGNIPVVAGGKQYAGFHNVANHFGCTITISGSGANAGYVAFHAIPIFATDCSVIDDNDDFVLAFVYYMLLNKQGEIYKLQSGGAQPHIYPKNIEDIIVSIPPTIAEQSAIAAVLSGMDTEIAALEQKRDKYIAIKSGMMQDLLTGKIRLV